jgi:hypothetical protein
MLNKAAMYSRTYVYDPILNGINTVANVEVVYKKGLANTDVW